MCIKYALWIYLGSVFCTAIDPLGSDGPPSVSAERRLIQAVLAQYSAQGKVARPVADSADCVNVQFGIRLVHLDLDEKEQVMTTCVWIRMTWKDDLLKWNPGLYNGITTIIIPAENIWIPDLALVNTAETTLKEQPADVIVKYNGLVFWAPQRKYSSACLIDVTEFPYDKHTCEMWFQSISNRGSHLNITAYHKSPLDLDTYLSSYRDAQEWTILANETTWHERPRDVGMILMWSRRPSLKFTLTVQRRPGFKAMLLIVPCSLLSFIIPLIFCFPPERPDRHTLGFSSHKNNHIIPLLIHVLFPAMSLFASLTILLFMVNEVAPPSASFVPRLALYYCFNLLILLLATCCSTVVVNLSKRGETREKVPKLIRLIFIKGLGQCLCFGRRIEHLSEVKRASRRSRVRNTSEPCNTRMPCDDIIPPLPEAYPSQYSAPDENSATNTNHFQTLNLTISGLNKKLNAIHHHLMQEKNKAKSEVDDLSIPAEVRVEWRTLSLVLDRLFFVIFLILNIVSLGVFYPRMP